jgi:alkaline phosphatase D
MRGTRLGMGLLCLAACVLFVANSDKLNVAAERGTVAASLVDEQQPQEKKKPKQPKYKRRHTRVFEMLLRGQTDKARERLAEWFAADPDDPENHYVLAVIESQAGGVPKAVVAMRRAVELGMPPERFVAGTHTLLDPIKSTSEFAAMEAQLHDQAVSGPMVAAVTPTSTTVWVRTARPASVEVVAAPSEGSSANVKSATVHSTEASDRTAMAVLEGLQPHTVYHYAVLIDGAEDDVHAAAQTFQTAPPIGQPAKFRVAFGGCAGYTPSNERIWDTILSFKPQAMWLLGDNEYIDQPEMPPLQYYCFYRRQARPEFRRLVAGTPTYAIWDDHDFGDNDCWGGPEVEHPPWKRAVWNVFRQTWVNPYYGGGERHPGCWFDYHYGDVHFILLDGRYYRSGPEHGVDPPTMLGPVQKKWLLDTLARSEATIKVLVSPVTWAFDTKGDSPDTWNGFREERQEIFDFLAERKITGVVLVSSDRHRSDLLKNERANGYTLHEFNSGLLTNDSVHPELDSAVFSYNGRPSFGLIEFDTLAETASVTYRIIDIDGREHLSFTVHESELR